MWAVTAHVPVAEMFGYAVDLHTRTMGRGTFSAVFASYRAVDQGDHGGAGDHAMAWAPRPLQPGPRPSAIEWPEPDPDDDGFARA